MFFLRLAFFLIIALGALVYLISSRIRSEFLRTGEQPHPLFRSQNAEFKAFCKFPPTPYIARLVKLKKQLSIALMITFLVFLLTVLAVVYEQTVT